MHDPMLATHYYNVRMRASVGKSHVSGAERIVSLDLIQQTILELTARACTKEKRPDQIILSIEDLGPTIPYLLRMLELTSLQPTDPLTAQATAGRKLRETGVSVQAVERGLALLRSGPGPEGVTMRGAVILNASTGERLEPDQSRGVRASRFDWSADAGNRMRARLSQSGFPHFRTYEALALATKIAYGPGVMAELCWSDDPDYTAGYVASARNGYIRFPVLKAYGETKGGRIIFSDGTSGTTDLIRYLETEAVLITDDAGSSDR